MPAGGQVGDAPFVRRGAGLGHPTFHRRNLAVDLAGIAAMRRAVDVRGDGRHVADLRLGLERGRRIVNEGADVGGHEVRAVLLAEQRVDHRVAGQVR